MTTPFTKRFFLKGKFIFLCMFILLLQACSQQIEIGMQLFSFDKQLNKDPSYMLKKVAAMGFREVEWGGNLGIPAKKFRELLDQNNLKMVGIAATFEQLTENPMAVVDSAQVFDAQYATCYIIPHKGPFSIEDVNNAVATFNKAGKVLKENGISLCYHIHGFEFIPYKGETLFDYFIRGLDPAYANIEMDVFWVKHAGQDPVQWLQKYPNRFPLMHLKDRKPGTPGNHTGSADAESNVALGAGDVGIEAIMKIAAQKGVKHFFIEDESTDPEQQVPKSLQYMKSILK
jgi:sugar phosphate isomerase/epimerase